MFFAAIVMLLFLDAGVGLACSLFLVDDKFVVVWVILIDSTHALISYPSAPNRGLHRAVTSVEINSHVVRRLY